MIALRKLLSAVIGTGAGAAVALDAPTYHGRDSSKTSYQATVTGTGAVSGTVLVQVSNDQVNWLTLGTITLSGTTSASDGFAADAPWGFVRGNCTAISGTGAAIDLVQGVSR